MKLCDGLAWNIRWSSDDAKPEEFYRQAQDCYVFSGATRTPPENEPLFVPSALMNLSFTELVEATVKHKSYRCDSPKETETYSSELAAGETSFYSNAMVLFNLSMLHISSRLPPALYFISRAYQVNIMFLNSRTSEDYRVVVDLCDEAVGVNDRLKRESFSDLRVGPVQFSLNTDWSIIYDRQIQTILGFMSLTRHLASRPDGAPQVIPLCPLMFMLYIRLKCFLMLKKPQDSVQLANHNFVCRYQNAFSCKILLLAYQMDVRLTS